MLALDSTNESSSPHPISVFQSFEPLSPHQWCWYCSAPIWCTLCFTRGVLGANTKCSNPTLFAECFHKGVDNSIDLIIKGLGSDALQGLEFIVSCMFLERLYTVCDATNSRVGFATTANIYIDTNSPVKVRFIKLPSFLTPTVRIRVKGVCAWKRVYTIGVWDIWWRAVLTEIIHKRHSSSSNDHRDTFLRPL